GPYTFAVTSGALPDGLTLTAGRLSGTPTAAGAFHFTVTATDSAGFTGSRDYALTVSPDTVVKTNGLAGSGSGGSGGSPNGALTGAPVPLPPPGGDVPAGLSGSQLYVARLYRDLLGRAPDAAGLAFFAGRLDRGEASREQVVRELQQSPEYSRRLV